MTEDNRGTLIVMQHLDHAIQIAIEAHERQTDKIGRPFFEHCQRVALLVSGDEARTVAYLHDVVDKGRGWTLDRLKEEGFAPGIIAAVDAPTRRPEEADDQFVRRAASNPLALPVKQADLEDNLWQGSKPTRMRKNTGAAWLSLATSKPENKVRHIPGARS